MPRFNVQHPVTKEWRCFSTVVALAVEDLEELNSDYINEHFGELQDEAYQRGLDDAWKLAEDVLYNRGNVLDIMRCATVGAAFDKYSAGQAMDMLKAYEEKQKADDEIKVGDEVTHKSDSVVWKAVCIQIDGDGRHMNLMGHTGAVGYYPVDDFKKTGRHYDIDKILEAIKHD